MDGKASAKEDRDGGAPVEIHPRYQGLTPVAMGARVAGDVLFMPPEHQLAVARFLTASGLVPLAA